MKKNKPLVFILICFLVACYQSADIPELNVLPYSLMDGKKKIDEINRSHYKIYTVVHVAETMDTLLIDSLPKKELLSILNKFDIRSNSKWRDYELDSTITGNSRTYEYNCTTGRNYVRTQIDNYMDAELQSSFSYRGRSSLISGMKQSLTFNPHENIKLETVIYDKLNKDSSRIINEYIWQSIED